MRPPVRDARLWAEEVDGHANRYVRRWMRHFPAIRDTSIESWLEALKPSVLPTRLQRLSSRERDLLVAEHWRRRVGRPSLGEAMEPIVQILEELVLWAQGSSALGAAFLRLGTRAPIDSPLGIEAELQVDGGTEALELMLDSERMFEDLCLAQECSYSPALIARPWLEIDPACELRAFLRDRRLVGLSQRQTRGVLPNLVLRASALEATTRKLLDELAPRWPLDDLVVDLVCTDEGEVWVADLQPWLPWGGSALFDWDDAMAEYSFRYLVE